MPEANPSPFYSVERIENGCSPNVCVLQTAALADAATAINKNDVGFCCLCNAEKKVKAVIYESDVTRLREQGHEEKSLLDGDCARNALLYAESPLFDINADYLFYSSPRKCFPIVDDKRRLTGIIRHTRPLSYPVKENPVVIMAGGLGMRLRPYTEKVPKPLLTLGGVSILERILTYFRYYGFRNFYISVNYLAEQIKEAMGDGSRFGLNIHYLHEKIWLGTAGAIALMPKPDLPCIVSNGDLLMDVNLDQFLNRHNELGASATMCTYCYKYKVAYGVVQAQESEYRGIVEKPTYSFQINTGLYCISPEAWGYFPKDKKFDMPTLFDVMSKDGRKVCVFPHEGKWIDIGTLNEFERLSAGTRKTRLR